MSPDQQNPNPQNPQPQINNDGLHPVVPALPSIPNNGHSGHNPYEFIFAAPPPKKSVWSSNALLLRIGLILGGVTVLVVILAVVLAAMTPKGSAPGMTSMAARQQEILRVANAGAKKATGQYTLNFIANINAAVTSDKHATTSYLLSHNTKLNPQILAGDYSAATNTLLEAAASTNTYDSAVAQNLTEQLAVYQKLISTTYKESSNARAGQILKKSYGNAAKLLEQAKTLK